MLKTNTLFNQVDSHIKFRKAKAIDALSITLTGKACSSDSQERWRSFSTDSIKDLAQKIATDTEIYWVAERANKIIGFASLCPVTKRVTNLLIDNAFSKKAIGFELLKLVEHKAVDLSIEPKSYLH